MAAAHRFSLISFRLKPNKAIKVATIVPTDSKQFQKSHFQSIENEQCLTETTPVHASVTTARIPMAIRHTIIKINLCCFLFSISSTCMGVLHHNLRHCIIVRRTMACIPSNRSSREEMRISYRTRLRFPYLPNSRSTILRTGALPLCSRSTPVEFSGERRTRRKKKYDERKQPGHRLKRGTYQTRRTGTFPNRK